MIAVRARIVLIALNSFNCWVHGANAIVGAEGFGWTKRTAEPRSMRDGRTLVGWGMATATWPAEALGMPVSKVTFELGYTGLPEAPVSGGWQTVASVGPAVQAAAKAACENRMLQTTVKTRVSVRPTPS
jgi:CO/xanthine dehydrogenase Mo-binding subunit